MNSIVLEHSPSHPARISDRNRTILLVGPVEEYGAGDRSVFSEFQWPAERAKNCRDAIPRISRDLHRVIVSEKDLPDGNWKDILEAAAAREHPPLLIVTSRLADEYLWAEVLNLGGYDVLAKPFDHDEVRRTVSLAWQHWESRREMASQSRRYNGGNARERNRRENRETGRAHQGTGHS